MLYEYDLVERNIRFTTELNEVQKEKAIFVSGVLRKLLQQANVGVSDAIYRLSTGKEEYIQLVSDNGHNVYINVTCDSKLAIVRDVLKNLD